MSAMNFDSSYLAVMDVRRLKVEELRGELRRRGLGIAGTKHVLVRRLESALRDEAAKLKDSGDGSGVGRKRLRGRDADDSDSRAQRFKSIDELQCLNAKNLPKDDTEEHRKESEDSSSVFKKNKIEGVQKMSVKQLREEAARRGIPAAGTKNELLERLCADDYTNVSSTSDQEEKIVTATKKGSAVLDGWLPDNIKAHYHVLQVGDEIYDAVLNQTNIGENNNKFFVIQVLESDNGGNFMVYYRWGRVGVKGQNKLNGPYKSQMTAISEFEKKFFDKTKNRWSFRKEFICHPRTYTWLEMDYNETTNELADQEEKHTQIVRAEPRESKLDPRIANFISLICNLSMMQQQMMEIGYNAQKLPLGKLSKSTILKGYDVLKRIADVINKADRKNLEQLSGEFYTVIPHDFGFRKTSLYTIDTPQKLKSKLEMVEALGEIEVAMKLINDDYDMEDPFYSQYRRLHCELFPLDSDTKEFSMIEKYTKNTHAETHSGYEVNIIQIFKLSREGETERFEKFSRTNNRMLLWHGSRLTNWTGILSQGLRIAPPEAPSTGYMFGKGVYFADMFSKSANYCFANQSTRDGVLVLCEVALGDMAELVDANSKADRLPAGKLSTKGVGQTAPDISECLVLEDGVLVPLGPPKKQAVSQCRLLYNEYIVYNVEQIRMRYLVQLKFNFR